jgi:hypothetical protein
MAEHGEGDTRHPGTGEPGDERMGAALESRLAATEEVVYSLASTGLVQDDDRGRLQKCGGDGGAVLAATDRKLVIVVDTGSGLETADVPYTDLKGITYEGGLLGSTLSVRIWGRGTVEFDPRRGENAADLADFVEAAGESWRLVVAALQDARQHVAPLPEYVERGDLAAARDARESARETLGKAGDRAERAPETIRAALEERIERAETDIARTRAAARLARTRALIEEGAVRTAADEYDAAAETFVRAREHVETAFRVALENDLALIEEIQAEVRRLDDRVARLAARPLERGDRARERAQDAGRPALAALAWRDALDHYRGALTAGWGTPVEFDGDRDALRLQVEWVATNLACARQRAADRLEAAADGHREAGEDGDAHTCERAARDHLRAAERVASQYRAGDADAIRERLADIEARLAD